MKTLSCNVANFALFVWWTNELIPSAQCSESTESTPAKRITAALAFFLFTFFFLYQPLFWFQLVHTSDLAVGTILYRWYMWRKSVCLISCGETTNMRFACPSLSFSQKHQPCHLWQSQYLANRCWVDCSSSSSSIRSSSSKTLSVFSRFLSLVSLVSWIFKICSWSDGALAIKKCIY